jgi:hypothetical protein
MPRIRRTNRPANGVPVPKQTIADDVNGGQLIEDVVCVVEYVKELMTAGRLTADQLARVRALLRNPAEEEAARNLVRCASVAVNQAMRLMNGVVIPNLPNLPEERI